MRRAAWLAFLSLACTPVFASTIQVEPDPVGTKFELTTKSEGIVLKPDTETDFSVSLAKFEPAKPYDPPRQPVEGWFEITAGEAAAGNEFALKMGLPYDILRSDDTVPLTVLVQKVEGSDFDVDNFLHSVHTANLKSPAVLVRHFWLAKEIWEARKMVLDKNQRDINPFDVSVAYYYVLLAREMLTTLTVAAPDSSIDASNWLHDLASLPQPSKRLFNDQTVPAKTAEQAVAALQSVAGIQDGRIGRIVNALDADFTDSGVGDETACGRANQALDLIGKLNRAQWGKDMPSYRKRALIYSSNCLAYSVNQIGKGESERFEALKAQSAPLLSALTSLKSKGLDVRSVIQVLREAVANAAKRV